MKTILSVSLFLSFSFSFYSQLTWEARTTFPGTGGNHAIAFSHGTKGYLMTGINNADYKDFWEYDHVNNTWTQLPNYPGPKRSYGLGLVIGDKAYIGFGHTLSLSGYQNDWWEYDFTTTTWTQKTTSQVQEEIIRHLKLRMEKSTWDLEIQILSNSRIGGNTIQRMINGHKKQIILD